MDVFAGDRKLPNAVVFHPVNYLTPFPEPRYPIFHNPTAEIKPLQPQKLRPIRSQVRNSDDNSDHEAIGKHGGDCVMNCYGPELGFLTQLETQKASVGNELRCESSSQAYNGINVVADIGGGDVSRTVREMKSEMDAQIMELISQGHSLEAEFSSSSYDGSGSSEAIREPTNQKRKRKKRKALKLLMENIARKFLHNQEEMNKRLLEILEKNEKERLIREEAWKQQEIERAQRDEELRLEETSRNLALIFYIQDLLGHEIEISKPSFEVPCPAKDEEITTNDNCNSDPSNRRWSKAEVQSLITIRTALDHKFVNGHRGSSWEMVAGGLFKMGYNRTSKKCREKWENINKYYRKTLENGKTLENSKSLPYFQELDIIYKSGLITTVDDTNNI